MPAACTAPLCGPCIPLDAPSGHGCVFLEVFAGFGRLTAAVRSVGVPALHPQDLRYQGVDVLDDESLRQLLDT